MSPRLPSSQRNQTATTINASSESKKSPSVPRKPTPKFKQVIKPNSPLLQVGNITSSLPNRSILLKTPSKQTTGFNKENGPKFSPRFKIPSNSIDVFSPVTNNKKPTALTPVTPQRLNIQNPRSSPFSVESKSISSPTSADAKSNTPRFKLLYTPRFVPKSNIPKSIETFASPPKTPSTNQKSLLNNSKSSNWSPSPKKQRSFFIRGGLSDSIQTALTNAEAIRYLQRDLGLNKNKAISKPCTIKNITRWNRFTYSATILTSPYTTAQQQILLIDPDKDNISNLKAGDILSLGNEFTKISNTTVYLSWNKEES